MNLPLSLSALRAPASISQNSRAFSTDVDVVLLWVDGADPAWQAAMRKRRAAWEGADGQDHMSYGTSASRFEQRDELRYTLRSIEKFAPFFRRIYLVTNGQVPAWLNTAHPRLHLTRH